METESDYFALWYPRKSQAWTDWKYQKQRFGPEKRVQSLVAEARAGSIFDKAALLDIVYYVDDSLNSEDASRATLDFEEHFIDACWDDFESELVDAYCVASSSYKQLSDGEIDKNSIFVSSAMGVMVVYVTCLLFRFDAVRSRALLGGTIVLTVGLALLFALGVCGWVGVPFSVLSFLSLFIILGVGIDDMIIVVDARVVRGQIFPENNDDDAFVTFFAACLALHERRVEANRYELAPCFRRAAAEEDAEDGAKVAAEDAVAEDKAVAVARDGGDGGVELGKAPPSGASPAAADDDDAPWLTARLTALMRSLGAWLTASPARPRAVACAFFLLAAGAAAAAGTALRVGADWDLFLPKGCYLLDYYDARGAGAFRLLLRGRDGPFGRRERTFESEFDVTYVTGRVVVERESHRRALEDLSAEAANLKGTKPPVYGWYEAWRDAAGNDTSFAGLETFLASPSGNAYREDVVLGDGLVDASRLRTVASFPEQTCVALFLVSRGYRPPSQAGPGGLMLPPKATALVALMIVLVNLSILGVMALGRFQLNVSSLLNLIMAVGFSDFAAHRRACAHNVRRGDDVESAVRGALEDLGASVLNGGLSTLLAVTVLAFSDYCAYFQMFIMFLAMVLSGLLHGLVLLPALFLILFRELYPGLKVIGCSEYVPRSEKRRSADAEIVAQNAKHDTHPGYYEERYGMNWLQSKIRELFVSYRCEVLLLPVDSRGAVRRMHDASFDDRPAGIEIEFVSEADGLKHHPLVRATRHIDADLRALSGRVGVDWRAYLDGLCALPPAPEPSPLELRPLAPPPKPRSPRRRSKSPAPPAAPAAAPPAPPPLFDEDSDDEDTPLSVLLARAGP
ncbi:RNA uridylyltransferase [Aureococcus anophagefferens]|nr:RNA uridylyltransferase [Aureococcus anophagefferens]